jgi:uncharacterized protein
MNLSNVNVLVTGGSRGIGEAIARELVAKGAKPVLVARNGDLLRKVAQSLSAHAVVADLADASQVDGLFARCETEIGGPIDVVINNAGLDEFGVVSKATAEDVRRIHQVNLLTPIELCRQAMSPMLERKKGHLVNVSSMAAAGAFSGMALYASTKGGLSSFTGVLDLELAGAPVNTTLVELGPVPSDMLTGIFEHDSARLAFDRFRKFQLMPNVPKEKVAAAVVAAIANDRKHVRLPKRAAAFPILRGVSQKVVNRLLTGIPAESLR